jgi:acetoin utilization deacetylase AcuC-like enzyme
VDWDYHHGNSTEHFFYNDPSVFFFSTHDQFAYPWTGSPHKKGDGNGLGYNVNVHMPCGTNDKEILEVYRTNLFERALKFKPDFILISAGFDSRRDDPLGCFDLSDEVFEDLTEIIVDIGNKFCDGRVLSILEGGYNIAGNSSATIKHINALKNF